MTCIVGYTDGKRAAIGGDSAGIAGHTLTIRADEKVFQSGSYVLGFTSSFRMGQLLRYKAVLPSPPENLREMDRFMATAFVDAVREALKAGGFAKKENEVESGGTFLVAVGPSLYCIQSDYQVERSRSPFLACGCGEDAALGAMSMLESLGWKGSSPDALCAMALSAVERVNTGVRGPFEILTAP